MVIIDPPAPRNERADTRGFANRISILAIKPCYTIPHWNRNWCERHLSYTRPFQRVDRAVSATANKAVQCIADAIPLDSLVERPCARRAILPEIKEVEHGRPAARQDLRRLLQRPAIGADHSQEVMGVKERLDNRSGMEQSIFIVGENKRLAGALRHDLQNHRFNARSGGNSRRAAQMRSVRCPSR
jgi:hypothetical protein